MTAIRTSTGGLDMSQFYRVFFEESEEHLGTMESLLLAIDPGTASDEDLNAIFRAAHSIKGGSGTFGFTDMTEVTHELESLLDRARRHEITLTAEMIDALLAAGDVLKAQLARHRGEPGAAEPAVAGVCERIRRFVSGTPSAPPPAAHERRLTLRFPAGPGGTAPEALLEELARLGRIESRDVAGGRCTVCLHTAADECSLREAFSFTVEPAEVEIAPAAEAGFGFFTDDAPVQEADPGYGFFSEPAAAPESDPGYGFFAAEPVANDALPPPAKAAAPQWGRRKSDAPQVEGARAGRRDTDKVVVSPHGDQASIRVGVEKVDQLINQVGELVTTQAMLAQAVTTLDPVQARALLAAMADLERNTRNLQESVMSIRMLPISFVFNRFPRVARDLAAKLGKQVSLVLDGEGTELDKGLIEKIADPLTHLVRNSIDHGIETPERRVAAGKGATGTVTLRASHQGGNIVIQVTDDGGGLDRERILAKARERGMAVHDGMTDPEVYQLIFEAGFSTAAEVTDVSGRGVGMDVVKRNIKEMGGHVEIDSAPGAGTRISIRLPLTLAILDGLSVAVGSETFVIPLTNIVESLQPAARDVKTIAGRGRVMQVRGEFVPVVALHELFGIRSGATEAERGIMVILEAEGAKTALFVDGLLGQHQVVIKSLETNYRSVRGVSGATILGDGRVALILDVAGLVRMAPAGLALAA